MDRIERLKELLEQHPTDSFLNHALGLEYQKIGDKIKAILLFRSVLEHDENYLGSYYQLAKLLEEQGDVSEAMLVFEKGMNKAQEQGDQHAYNELRSAYEELIY